MAVAAEIQTGCADKTEMGQKQQWHIFLSSAWQHFKKTDPAESISSVGIRGSPGCWWEGTQASSLNTLEVTASSCEMAMHSHLGGPMASVIQSDAYLLFIFPRRRPHHMPCTQGHMNQPWWAGRNK